MSTHELEEKFLNLATPLLGEAVALGWLFAKSTL